MSGPRWLLAVVGDDTGFSTPFIIIVPRDVVIHDQAARVLRRGGWARPSFHEWGRGAYSLAPAGAVDVVKHQLVRVTTGTASLYADGERRTTPMWTSAARERRALVTLVPADAFPDDSYTPEQCRDRMAELAAERAVLAALAAVRFDLFTGPYPPGWGKS